MMVRLPDYDWQLISEKLDQARAEERERIVKGLLKEYKGQESQIQDAVNYISSLEDKK